jgi:hypothetical protein
MIKTWISAPQFISYVALLDASNTESLTIQDNQGRNSMQILTFAAAREDSNHIFVATKIYLINPSNLHFEAYTDTSVSFCSFGSP